MWHTLSEKRLMNNLKTSADGLSRDEAEKRLEKVGKNSFEENKKKSFAGAFFKQMSDSMVLILLASAAISVAVSYISGEGEYLDALIILAIVVFNAITGVVQEFKAEHSLEALKKMNSPVAKVIRQGKEESINTEYLVPGDIILLNTGDFVPADARLISATALTADESALTGETREVEKNCAISPDGQAELEATNMVWAHTVVTGGRGRAVVVGTGMNTQTGKVAGMIINSQPPQTPLQLRLKKTGNVLGMTAISICVIIFLMGIVRHQPPLEMFMTSISLAVAAIPEGLPAIVTIMLAIGVQKMAKKNAVVRKLPAVETLGSATVICTDKTGTLTKNEMTITDVYGDRKKVLEHCSLCNDERGATEKALIKAAEKEGMSKKELDSIFVRKDEIPFSSSRKLMTTVHKTGGGYKVITKGAPDILIPLCSISENQKKEILERNKELAAEGKRVIAVASKEISELGGRYEENLIFTGLAAMTDPPRDGVPRAVKSCRDAGIRVVMITGDQQDTALAIARQTGICGDGEKAVSGKELDLMSDAQLEKEVKNCKVFSRVTPEHKMRIVHAFQKNGEVVAMTGDGVNDAPALKSADIGCAMGKSGTDVAKGAADMVLADDNFVTIAEAVRQGRGIYANIKKAVRFLLSSNIGEIFTIFIAIFFGKDSPLTPIQLLWMNLVTDSLPAAALGLQPPDRDIMQKKPVSKNEGVFSEGMGHTILIEGVMIGVIATLAHTIGEKYFGSACVGQTMTFCTLSMSQLFHALAVESEHSLFSGYAGRNKFMPGAFVICMIMQIAVVALSPLRGIFKTTALSFLQWACVVVLSSLPLIISEIEKISVKERNNKKLDIAKKL
ncbi:MAG: calcium-translocating P-type ATPase, PMCA-type [Clostridia bacterium]|nr:calcium-translocating P-type ATPase, PMCA-type [Clostridia bacterium]